MDVLAFMLVLFMQSVHQVEFGRHQPARVRLGVANGFYYIFGGTNIVRFLTDFKRAFRVRDHLRFRIFLFEIVDLLTSGIPIR